MLLSMAVSFNAYGMVDLVNNTKLRLSCEVKETNLAHTAPGHSKITFSNVLAPNSSALFENSDWNLATSHAQMTITCRASSGLSYTGFLNKDSSFWRYDEGNQRILPTPGGILFLKLIDKNPADEDDLYDSDDHTHYPDLWIKGTPGRITAENQYEHLAQPTELKLQHF